MPYIKRADRIDVNGVVSAAKGVFNGEREDRRLHTPGVLNYLITQLCIAYLNCKGKSYQHINDVLGALEGAKQELYRRVASPYEDVKIVANDDVYPAELAPHRSTLEEDENA